MTPGEPAARARHGVVDSRYMTPEKGGMKTMSSGSLREVLVVMRERYSRRKRVGKTRMIDEFCELSGVSRKHAIKVLNGRCGVRRRRPGPVAVYGAVETKVLVWIWLKADQPCSKRLRAALPLWVPSYERHEGVLKAAVRQRLLHVSAATIDRLLAPRRAQFPRALRTRPAGLRALMAEVPVRMGPWQEHTPGWMEIDTVAHCGGSMAGSFVWTLAATDVLCCWTCRRAVWNRGQAGVLEQIRDMEARLPFALRGLDVDNGGEFLNHHLVGYARNRQPPIKLTRSRPYRKNDNAHIEQKNRTHVRELLGYDRFEDPAIAELLNPLYRDCLDPLANLFLPVARLIAKQRHGGRVTRQHDTPATPCDRLLAWPDLPPTTRHALLALRASLDPADLAAHAQTALRRVFAHPGVVPELRHAKYRRPDSPPPPTSYKGPFSGAGNPGCHNDTPTHHLPAKHGTVYGVMDRESTPRAHRRPAGVMLP